jgi:hypothetical protein
MKRGLISQSVLKKRLLFKKLFMKNRLVTQGKRCSNVAGNSKIDAVQMALQVQ